MKRIYFTKFLFLYSVLFFIHLPADFDTPDLGKTHFIVGYPAHASSSKVSPAPVTPSVCLSGKLSDMLRCKDGALKQAFFSPDDDVQKVLIELINYEQEKIQAAIFSFTDGEIAQALLQAKARGVAIEIVTDISSVRDKFNKIELLKKNKINVHVYKPQTVTIFNNIMHNKFVIFEKNIDNKSLLWTGSFNFTKSAKMNNQENVIVLDDKPLIDRYYQQFVKLKERTHKKETLKVAHKKKNKLLMAGKKRFITTIPS